MSIALLLGAAALWVAYANGANDNFKGVATLYGSGTLGYRGALTWATITTGLGSLASAFLARELATAFSAKGLVPEAVAGTPEFLAAVALGAALTVFVAALAGFPISTTHSLVGALVGAGWVAARGSLDLARLGKSFFVPLLVSPLIAVALGAVVYRLARWARLRLGVTKESCICIGATEQWIAEPGVGTLAARAILPVPGAMVGRLGECGQRYRGRLLGVSGQRLVDAMHFLSAGAVSFARGLNDTPKIAGLLFVLQALPVQINFMLIAAAIAVGGLLNARPVAQTVSREITTMNHGQGLSANLVTSFLVIFASRLGVPVSTTHVSCGSLFGMGLTTGQANRGVIGRVVLSWVLTLPVAALLSVAFVTLLAR